jgi:hypothetical protein
VFSLVFYKMILSNCFLVIFAGFEAFTPHNSEWSQWILHWGWNFAPFGVIAGFFGLIILSRFVLGSSAFEVPPTSRMDLKTQRARKLAPLPDSKFTWKTAVSEVLNY